LLFAVVLFFDELFFDDLFLSLMSAISTLV